MALLAVHQTDPVSVARLTAALGSGHELVPCGDWSALWDAVAELPLDGCIVDVYLPNRAVGFTEVQRLRKRRPTMGIMVYSDFDGRALDLFELGRLEVDAVLLSGEKESLRGIREAVSEALVSSLAAQVNGTLAGRIAPPGPDLLRWAIENAHRRPPVRELTEGLSFTPRSLSRVLDRASLPSPSRLLLWGRLFRAAQLLDEGGASVEQVAYTLGYSTGAALSRAFKRITGHAPSELKKRGVLGAVLDAYVRREAGGSGARRSWSRGAHRPAPFIRRGGR